MSAGLWAALAVATLGLAVRPRVAAARHPLPDPERCPRLGSKDAGRSRGPSYRARRAEGGPDAVARWCDDVARACRSGSALASAVRDVAVPDELAEPLAEVHLALDRGAPLTAALDAALRPTRRGPSDPDLALAVTVLRACAEHGGPPSEPLDRAAATLRARAADLAERRTQSAQARLSAVVMTWLPVVMLTVLLASSPAVRAVAVQPVGVGVIAAGAGLNVAGWRWMRRIVGGRA